MESVRQNLSRVKQAEEFIAKGWSPVPVPAREKGPIIKDWQNRQFTPDDFREDGNIGLKLGTASGSLVDIDLDCPEAIELAPHFLPETRMVHGRKTKPCSHHWYVVTDTLPDTKRYKDVDGATLIELRSTGGQTIIPPSIHPSGEQLHWNGDELEPAKVSGAELARRVALIASIALIARHWPTNGSRHDCAMAVAGYLARGRMNGDEVVGIIRYAAEAAGDEEVEDREKAALDTVLKLERGEAVTGGPTLKEMLGEQVVNKLKEWLGLRQTFSAEWVEENEQRRGASAADTLIDLAFASGATFFHTPEQEAYARFPVKGHMEVSPLRKKAVRMWLRQLYRQRTGHAAGTQTIEDAIANLEAAAIYDGEEAQVHIRIAYHNGAVYHDLGNEAWEAVEITADGWRVISNPPVYFMRPKGAQALPTPECGGSLADLRPFLNVGKDDDAWILAQAWLLGNFQPTGPRPHLGLSAAAGSGKSRTTAYLRRLIDPNSTEMRDKPETAQDVIRAAKSNALIAYDNLSGMPTWLSDLLCTLSTGAGSSTRQLYTDDDEVFFNGKRCVIFNGIDELATRGDLLTRTIMLYPPTLTQGRTEEELNAAFEKAAPGILGAIYDAISTALHNRGNVQIEKPGRMADFEKWATAAEPALGVEPGAFLAAYRHNQGNSSLLVLEASPVAQAIQKFMRDQTTWTGTATELREILTRQESRENDRHWPIDGPRMSNALRRVEPNLRAVGILVTHGTGGRNGRSITITQSRSGGNSNADNRNSKAHFTVPQQPRQGAGSEQWTSGNSKFPHHSYVEEALAASFKRGA